MRALHQRYIERYVTQTLRRMAQQTLHKRYTLFRGVTHVTLGHVTPRCGGAGWAKCA